MLMIYLNLCNSDKESHAIAVVHGSDVIGRRHFLCEKKVISAGRTTHIACVLYVISTKNGYAYNIGGINTPAKFHRDWLHAAILRS